MSAVKNNLQITNDQQAHNPAKHQHSTLGHDFQASQ
jgi:hypothetical protein